MKERTQTVWALVGVAICAVGLGLAWRRGEPTWMDMVLVFGGAGVVFPARIGELLATAADTVERVWRRQRWTPGEPRDGGADDG